MQSLSELISKNAQPGILQWIGIRPQRREPLISLDQVRAEQAGLVGDHYQSGGKRTVTLLQYEHLQAIASYLKISSVAPELLRRNLIISSFNLAGLRGKKFQIGDVILEGTGICAPCSRMEEAFGKGGYSAVRGHGGITASVITPGTLSIGDNLTLV